jgi:hypothetical protein
VQDPPSVQEALILRDSLLQQLKIQLFKAQNYMKQQTDKNRRDFHLYVGDFALVKL